MVVGLWSIVVGVIILLGMKKNKLFASLFIMPLVIGLFVSFWAPMMMYFRFIYLIPVMSILLSIAIVPSKHKVINWIPTFVGMTVFIVYSLIYLLLPQFHREDWKKMVSDINPTQPTYMIIPSSDPVRYYDSGISIYELRDIQKAVLPEHIQVIPYVEEIYGYNHIDILKKKGCVRGLRSEYRGPLVLEQWTCSSSFVGHKGVSAI